MYQPLPELDVHEDLHNPEDCLSAAAVNAIDFDKSQLDRVKFDVEPKPTHSLPALATKTISRHVPRKYLSFAPVYRLDDSSAQLSEQGLRGLEVVPSTVSLSALTTSLSPQSKLLPLSPINVVPTESSKSPKHVLKALIPKTFTLPTNSQLIDSIREYDSCESKSSIVGDESCTIQEINSCVNVSTINLASSSNNPYIVYSPRFHKILTDSDVEADCTAYHQYPPFRTPPPLPPKFRQHHHHDQIEESQVDTDSTSSGLKRLLKVQPVSFNRPCLDQSDRLRRYMSSFDYRKMINGVNVDSDDLNYITAPPLCAASPQYIDDYPGLAEDFAGDWMNPVESATNIRVNHEKSDEIHKLLRLQLQQMK